MTTFIDRTRDKKEKTLLIQYLSIGTKSVIESAEMVPEEFETCTLLIKNIAGSNYDFIECKVKGEENKFYYFGHWNDGC